MGGSARTERGLGADRGLRLLLDENLSRHLVPALQERFPGSSQVALLGLEQADDLVLWEHARRHDFVLVSKDEDFKDLQTLLQSTGRVLDLLQQDSVGVVEVS